MYSIESNEARGVWQWLLPISDSPRKKTNEIIQGYFHPNRTGVIRCGNWLEPLSVVHDFMCILSSKVFNDKMCLVIVAFAIFPQCY